LVLGSKGSTSEDRLAEPYVASAAHEVLVDKSSPRFSYGLEIFSSRFYPYQCPERGLCSMLPGSIEM
jgi:hypothetical protein